jgi:hypothetical protein
MEAIDKLGEERPSGKMVSFGVSNPRRPGARAPRERARHDGRRLPSRRSDRRVHDQNLASKEEALEAAREFMEMHRIHWPKWQGETEIREMYEEADDVRATQIEGSRVLEHAGGGRGHEPL